MSHATATDTTDDLQETLDPEAVSSLKQRSVSGAASYMGRTLLLHVFNLATAGVLAAYLTARDFGVYGLVVQIIGILTFFSDIGFGSALIQKKSEPTTADYQSVFTAQQLLSWGIFLITVGLSVSGILRGKIGTDGEWVLLALGFSFPLVGLKTMSSVILERKLAFNTLVLPQVIEQIVFNVLLIWLAMNQWGVLAYAIAVTARSIIGAGVMWWLQPWSIGLSIQKEALWSLLGVGVQFQLNDFLARIKDQLFYLVLGLWLPTEQFGYVTFAKTFSQLPYQLTVQNVIAVTFPTYSRLQHHPELLKRAIEKTLFFISLAIFPMLVGMAVFIEPLTHLIPRYAKWQPALGVFVLFTVSIAWGALSTPLTNTLNAIGKISLTLRLMIMWTILTWVLTPILVWQLGINGVGWAAVLISFSSILTVVYVKRVVPIQFLSSVWRQSVAALVMAVVGWWGLPWWQQSWVWLGSGMLLTGLVYMTMVLVLGWQKLKQEVLSLRT